MIPEMGPETHMGHDGVDETTFHSISVWQQSESRNVIRVLIVFRHNYNCCVLVITFIITIIAKLGLGLGCGVDHVALSLASSTAGLLNIPGTKPFLVLYQ